MNENLQKTFPCETCQVRKRAEEKPTSFMSRLWKFHTKFCPGWKAYQAHLASQESVPART